MKKKESKILKQIYELYDKYDLDGKLPEGREVFLRYTYSSKADAFYGSAVRKIADSNNTEIMVYGCRGYLACSSWFLSKVV